MLGRSVTKTARAGARSYISPSSLASYPQTHVTALSNGVRVATETSPSNKESASVGVFIDVGSRYESMQDNGVAHFLEHLSFKGTKNRSRIQIEMEVENMGGHLNAYTSREQTVFYSQIVKNDVPQALDILSDIILNSNYSEDAVNAERNVIMQEMESVYKESKEELIFDHMHEQAFQNQGLGRTILGSVENIENINSQQIRNYVQTHYTADRIVVVGAGAVDHATFVDECAKKFGAVPVAKVRPTMDSAYYRGGDYDERWDDMEKVYLAIAYETCGWNHPDVYPLMMLHTILGEGDQNRPDADLSTCEMSRKLFDQGSNKIMNNLTACDKYMTFNTLYSDTGLFGVYGQMHPYDVETFCFTVRDMMNRYCHVVADEELEEARQKLKTNILLQYDNSTQSMEDIGRQILNHGRRIHPTEILHRINDVDVNAVRNTAMKYLNDRDHVMAAVGPTHELPEHPVLRNESMRKGL